MKKLTPQCDSYVTSESGARKILRGEVDNWIRRKWLRRYCLPFKHVRSILLFHPCRYVKFDLFRRYALVNCDIITNAFQIADREFGSRGYTLLAPFQCLHMCILQLFDKSDGMTYCSNQDEIGGACNMHEDMKNTHIFIGIKAAE